MLYYSMERMAIHMSNQRLKTEVTMKTCGWLHVSPFLWHLGLSSYGYRRALCYLQTGFLFYSIFTLFSEEGCLIKANHIQHDQDICYTEKSKTILSHTLMLTSESLLALPSNYIPNLPTSHPPLGYNSGPNYLQISPCFNNHFLTCVSSCSHNLFSTQKTEWTIENLSHFFGYNTIMCLVLLEINSTAVVVMWSCPLSYPLYFSMRVRPLSHKEWNLCLFPLSLSRSEGGQSVDYIRRDTLQLSRLVYIVPHIISSLFWEAQLGNQQSFWEKAKEICR